MVVETFAMTPGLSGRLGLAVSAENVREHFPHGAREIELELDHLRIVCSLKPEFWDGRPEIRDARLSLWLEAKRLSGKLKGPQAPVAMIPMGAHAFRVEVIARNEAERGLTDVSAAAEAVPLPVDGLELVAHLPVAAFDRRKHGVARDPERRRVGKLKGNDSR